MPRERKERSKPGKMTDFFTPSCRSSDQDGADGLLGSPSHRQHAFTSHTDNHYREAAITDQTLLFQHPGDSRPSSSFNSPVKSKQRTSQTGYEGTPGAAIDDTLEFQDSIADFPTSNQPVMDSVLKDMLVSLRTAIHTDMVQLMNQCISEVNVVSERVSHIENKMGEFTDTFNDMVDAYNDHEDNIM